MREGRLEVMLEVEVEVEVEAKLLEEGVACFPSWIVCPYQLARKRRM